MVKLVNSSIHPDITFSLQELRSHPSMHMHVQSHVPFMHAPAWLNIELLGNGNAMAVAIPSESEHVMH